MDNSEEGFLRPRAKKFEYMQIHRLRPFLWWRLREKPVGYRRSICCKTKQKSWQTLQLRNQKKMKRKKYQSFHQSTQPSLTSKLECSTRIHVRSEGSQRGIDRPPWRACTPVNVFLCILCIELDTTLNVEITKRAPPTPAPTPDISGLIKTSRPNSRCGTIHLSIVEETTPTSFFFLVTLSLRARTVWCMGQATCSLCM